MGVWHLASCSLPLDEADILPQADGFSRCCRFIFPWPWRRTSVDVLEAPEGAMWRVKCADAECRSVADLGQRRSTQL